MELQLQNRKEQRILMKMQLNRLYVNNIIWFINLNKIQTYIFVQDDESSDSFEDSDNTNESSSRGTSLKKWFIYNNEIIFPYYDIDEKPRPSTKSKAVKKSSSASQLKKKGWSHISISVYYIYYQFFRCHRTKGSASIAQVSSVPQNIQKQGQFANSSSDNLRQRVYFLLLSVRIPR